MTEAITILRYEANKKNALTAYIIWLPFGLIGGHRFYLRKRKSGFFMLLSFFLSLLLFTLFPPLLFLHFLFFIIDALRIPSWTKKFNMELIKQLEEMG